MLLICMSIAGTVPLIICLLLLLLQRKKFSYRLGRNLVFLSLAGYLIPFQVVKYLMPTDVRFHHGGEKSLRNCSRNSFRKKQTGSCSLEKQLIGGQTYDEKESGIYYDEE